MSIKSIKRSLKDPDSDLNKFANAAADTLQALQPFPNMRMGSGITNRDQQIISWRLPNGTAVQMYINPQRLSIQDNKAINTIRTKGGFVVQYWGNELTQITVEGTTGSSGIKGINILEDIYNAENRAFELVAQAQTSTLIDRISGGGGSDADLADSILPQLSADLNNRNFILRPSLASLATSILMFYQGVQYKGFFKGFSVNESTDQLGMFNYTMNFVATEKRGKRDNFMSWHKEPMADDLAGQLINGIGNSLRRTFGLSDQAPESFHPENAPLTFGGNSLAAQLGFSSDEQQALQRDQAARLDILL
jgi:hypothetical protein